MALIQQIFYVSRGKSAITDWNVQEIVMTSSRNNAHQDISGCLLYTGRHFGQTLEGSPEALESLLGHLGDDGRHSGMKILLDRFVDQRRYAGWSMGYVRNLDLDDELELMAAAKARPAVETIERLMDRTKPRTQCAST